jgi:hypothetical protein
MAKRASGKPARKSTPTLGRSQTALAFRQDDGSDLICDPKAKLEEGCKVCVIYPKNRGQKEGQAKLGQLQSISLKSSIAWVVFPHSDDMESVCRIDQSKGYVVARVIGTYRNLL